ncbi:MAG: DNA-methyltransferase [Isosphaeraceae bacterium]|jgi:site-specific DNA-methyltransferase (adenine-specific)
MQPTAKVICGDAAETLSTFPSSSVVLTITSPPYYRQRDYGVIGQIGQERNLAGYLDRIGRVLQEILRVTDDAGSCFFVVGDTYANRRLLLVPHRIGLLADDLGWTVRNDLIWRKSSPAPESPRNRWRAGHEHVFFLTKRPSGYRFDADVLRVPHAEATLRRWGVGQVYGGSKSKNRRHAKDSRMRDGQVFKLNPKGCLPTDVWSIPSANTSAGHYAAFPSQMVKPLIEACSRPGELVLDPFAGSGTTCVVAVELGRRCLGVELNPEYAEMARAALAESWSKVA